MEYVQTTHVVEGGHYSRGMIWENSIHFPKSKSGVFGKQIHHTSVQLVLIKQHAFHHCDEALIRMIQEQLH